MKEVKKEKKVKDKKSIIQDRIILVLIIILIVMSIVIIALKIATRNNLDTSSELVTELHNYFNSEDLSNCEGLFNYGEDKITYENIDTETRLCLAYQKASIEDAETGTMKVTKKKETCTENGMTFRMDEDNDVCSYSKIKQEVIDNSYKKLYGKDIENNEEFKVDGLHICYLKDGYYYCGLSETFTYTLGNESLIYRVIDKAVEKGDKITIYDYFIKLNGESCFKNYTTNTINSKCTEQYKNQKDINYKFLKNYGTKYKHEFKKAEGGTYYWVNSTPLSEK